MPTKCSKCKRYDITEDKLCENCLLEQDECTCRPLISSVYLDPDNEAEYGLLEVDYKSGEYGDFSVDNTNFSSDFKF